MAVLSQCADRLAGARTALPHGTCARKGPQWIAAAARSIERTMQARGDTPPARFRGVLVSGFPRLSLSLSFGPRDGIAWQRALRTSGVGDRRGTRAGAGR